MSNVADAPVHVTSGAEHDICQPLVHLVMAMNQLMRHHKSQCTLSAQCQHQTCMTASMCLKRGTSNCFMTCHCAKAYILMGVWVLSSAGCHDFKAYAHATAAWCKKSHASMAQQSEPVVGSDPLRFCQVKSGSSCHCAR